MVQLAVLLLGISVAESHRIPMADLPCGRVTGVARKGDTWLVGGIRGLYIGKPGGQWRQASDQSVKRMQAVKDGAWVLYGNGGLDKVDIGADRLYGDILAGFAKRPWTSSFSIQGGGLLLGGQGGWIERNKEGLTENYPPDLKNQPVTAIATSGNALWLGTQDGLFKKDGSELTRLGFGAGLPDVWVTFLIPTDRGILAGLASGGVAEVHDGRVIDLACPEKKVRWLTRWNNHLVVGGLDGVWIRTGEAWSQISPQEATFLSEMAGELVVGEPDGIHFFRRSAQS